MTTMAWLLCALAIPLALGGDALLDEDKRAALLDWWRDPDPGGYRPRPSALPKSPPRGGSMGVPLKSPRNGGLGLRSGGWIGSSRVRTSSKYELSRITPRPWMAVNPRTIRIPRGGTAVCPPRGLDTSDLRDLLASAKAGLDARGPSGGRNAANIATAAELNRRLGRPAPKPRSGRRSW